MDLIINDYVVEINENQANYIMNVGFDSVSVSKEINTAEKLVTAINKVLNPYLRELASDYKVFKEYNFSFYSSILHATPGVEIVKEVENKATYFKFNGTFATFWI